MIRQNDMTQASVNQDADVKRRLLSIDSRFREDARMDRERARSTIANRPDNQLSGSSSNFKYRVPTPVRNVSKIKVVSVELPNTAQVVSAAKRNNSFIIGISGTDYTITIPDGNQDAATIVTALSTALTTGLATVPPSPPTIAVSVDAETGKLVLSLDTDFTAYFRTSTLGWPNRAQDWGLGYNLGFRVDSQVASLSGGVQVLSPSSLVNFTGETYQLLQINEENSVEHTAADNGQVRAVAKIPIAVGQNTIAQEEFPGLLNNSVSFRTPVDISVLNIKLVDAQGNVVDLNDVPMSLTLELHEITNTYLQESRRKHIGQDPANLG